MSNKIKLSDYVVQFLENKGVKYLFMVTGGNCLHLVDSAGKAKKLKYICNHHEQACAMAADGYARISGNIGACLVTNGPGATNAITGVLCSWLDSIPVLVLSGQIKRELMGAGKELRQLGEQEVNIIDVVKPITKYAVSVKNPNEIRYHLEKAVYLAKSGRPGPVWLEIPFDVQGSYIEKSSLKRFNPSEVNLSHITNKSTIRTLAAKVIDKLKQAKRPVMLIGNGVRSAKAEKELLELISLLRVPVLTAQMGLDLVSTENQYFAGRPGSFGTRTGNFTLQNSDCLLVIGSRLNNRMVGFNYKAFARNAYKIMVDIDQAELEKKTLNIDLKINTDVKDFIDEMIKQFKAKKNNFLRKNWWDKIKYWKKNYSPVLPEYWQQKNYVNPYCFISVLAKYLANEDILALGVSMGIFCTYQTLEFPQGIRIIRDSGAASMGYALPAAIGACYAKKKKRVICIEGDGSLQLNIQELATIAYHRLPIKIFIYSNQGYASIKFSQKALFAGNIVGSNPETGVSCPDISKIARAYGLKTRVISSHRGMEQKIIKIINSEDPILCEVKVSPEQRIAPKTATKRMPDGRLETRPLEDMFPFLSEEELKKNMISEESKTFF